MLAWYEMEQYILPAHVSWRELSEHWLTHDPLPKEEDGSRRIQLSPVGSISDPAGDVRARSAILEAPREMDVPAHHAGDRGSMHHEIRRCLAQSA